MIEAAILATLIAAPSNAPPVEVPASAAWRNERPPVPDPEPPVLPAFERGRLDNGLSVYVTRVPGVPLVSFELVTLGGSALDPEGQAGLTSLTYALLEEGTTELDALAFSDRVADLGARFGASAGRDSGSLSIGGLSRHADALLELLAQVARSPRLSAEDFERARAETLASLERSLGSPQGLAFMVFPRLVYGPKHPFGHPPTGTPGSVSSLTVEQVRAQHATLFQPQRSALVATGDIDLETAMALAGAAFGDWKASGGDVASVPAVEATPREAIHVVDRPDTPQTMVLFGRPIFEKGHPDEIPLTLGNEAWGGSFTSRLNMNLREEKGYTYGARSQVALRRGVGVFLAYAAVQTQYTGASVAEIFEELRDLASEPLSAEEVELAREGIVRSLTGQFQSTSAAASAAAGLFVNDLELDYFQTLGPRYAEADLDAIRAATQRYLDPEVMQVLLVGDLSEIRTQLEAEELGPIEVVDPLAE
jgi:predicted Zn-dependent peptidase